MVGRAAIQTGECDRTDPALSPCLVHQLGEMPDSADVASLRCERCSNSLQQMEQDFESLQSRWKPNSTPSREQAGWELIERLVVLDLSQAGDSVPANIGDYSLGELLGQGGMGRVYRATHQRLKKDVAIKVLSQKALSNPKALARFEREMEAVGTVEHVNVVSALDAGTKDGITYLVMELVQGPDCSQICDARPTITVASACEIVRQAATGLQHAHDRGLIHRDVKPSNLMLTTDSHGKPIVKVMDLGLAVVEADGGEHPLTDDGQLMGTLGFMAPEQATDTSKVDPRADIYSLGSTLFRILTGTIPFSGDGYRTPVQRLNGLLHDPTPPVGDRCKGLPKELASLIDQMLDRDPDNRPESMQEIAERLLPFSSGHDLLALKQSSGRTPTAGQSTVAPLAMADTAPTAAVTVTLAPSKPPPSPARSSLRWILPAGIILALCSAAVWFGRGQPSADWALKRSRDAQAVSRIQTTGQRAVNAETGRSIVYSMGGGFRGRLYMIGDDKWIDSTAAEGEVGFRVVEKKGLILTLRRFGGEGTLEVNLRSGQASYEGIRFYKIMSASAEPYVPGTNELRRVYFGTESSGDKFTGEFRLVNGIWKRNGPAPISKANFNVESQTDSQLKLVSDSGDVVVIDFSTGTISGNGPAKQIVLVGHTPRAPSPEEATASLQPLFTEDEPQSSSATNGRSLFDLSPDADNHTLAKWLFAQDGEIETNNHTLHELADIPLAPFRVRSVYLKAGQSEQHTNQLVAWVAEHPKCRKLIIRKPLGRSTMTALSKVKHLGWLELEAAVPLTDDDILELKNMPALRRLGFNSEKLTQRGWNHIRDQLALKELAIRAPQVSDVAMKTIAEIETLEVLTLFEVPLTKQLLEPLRKSSIKTLFTWGEDAAEEDVGAAIALIPGLTRVAFNNRTFQDKHLRGITGPPSLQELDLGHNLGVTAKGLEEFEERCPQIQLNASAMRLLESADFSDLSPDANNYAFGKWLFARGGEIESSGNRRFRSTASLPEASFEVRSVLLAPSSDKEASQLAAWVAEHPECTKLVLTRRPVQRDTMSVISKAKHLVRLNIMEAAPLEDDALLALENMQALSHLEINVEKLTLRGWKHLRDSLPLTELIVSAPTLSEEALEIIASMKTLDLLTLCEMPLTKRMLKTLKSSPITIFSYRGGGAIEQDIGVAIARMPNLIQVGFNSPSFRDEHLRGITGPPSLRLIGLPNPNRLNLSSAAVREFLKRNPQIGLTKPSARLLKRRLGL